MLPCGAFCGDDAAECAGIVGGAGHDDFGRKPFDERHRLRRAASLAGGKHKPDGTAEAARHGEMDLGAQTAA